MKRPPSRTFAAFALLGLMTLPGAASAAATAQVLLPLGRTAYQTNEWIDVSVVRVIVPGLPGFGQSKSEKPFSIASLADELQITEA